MLPAMADAGFRELEFADGKRGVDQPYADWIISATGGNTESVTFKAAMRLINHKLEKDVLRGVERAVYRDHFRQFGD